MFFKTSKS